jgi:hypothetical protein
METLNKNLMEETPFEMKPLRMIEINNVEVSEKVLTLTIEEDTPIMTRKAIIEEVPDEEAPTLVANQQPISNAIIEEILPLVNDSEDSDEELLNAATLESEDKMIIAYIKEEPVIGILKKEGHLIHRRSQLPKI